MGRKKAGSLGRARPLSLCGALAACVMLAPSRAWAEETPEQRDTALPAEVVVTLRAEDKPLLVELYHPRAKVGTDPPIARCTTPCFARVSPGYYRLFVHETPHTLAGGRVIELRQSTEVVVSPDHHYQRSTGLVLGIGGPVVAIVGAVLFGTSYCIEQCPGRSNNAAAGLVLMLGGLAVTPVGWIMFGLSFKPNLTLTPLPERALGERRSVAVPGGFRLGVTVAF